MKRLKFIKDNTGRVIDVVIDNGAISGDGSCIHITDQVLFEASRVGLVDKVLNGQNKRVYIKMGDITLVKVDEGKVVVFDSFVNGMWIGDLAGNNCVYYKYSGDKESSDDQRHIVRIVLHNVFTDKKPEIKDHHIPLNKYLFDLAAGRAGLPNDIYKYDEKESHHKKLACDNRLCVTDSLTKKEHNAVHKIISRSSHQVKIYVNTLEELVGLIQYLHSPKYFNSWKIKKK